MSIDEFKDYVIRAYNNEKNGRKTEVSDIIKDERDIQ